MLRISILTGAAIALLTGCSKEPDPRYDEPLTQSEQARQDAIDAHNAQPVALEGYHHVFVAGRSAEIQNCARCHQPDQEPYRDEGLAPWPRTPEVIGDQLAEYYGLISHMDHEIGRILAALDATGRRDDPGPGRCGVSGDGSMGGISPRARWRPTPPAP